MIRRNSVQASGTGRMARPRNSWRVAWLASTPGVACLLASLVATSVLADPQTPTFVKITLGIGD